MRLQNEMPMPLPHGTTTLQLVALCQTSLLFLSRWLFNFIDISSFYPFKACSLVLLSCYAVLAVESISLFPYSSCNMRVPKIALACSLLSTTASISAQELNPIVNMCIRFDHQCKKEMTANVLKPLMMIRRFIAVVKNNTLYIDGGRETFIDVRRNGSQYGSITEGYSE